MTNVTLFNGGTVREVRVAPVILDSKQLLVESPSSKVGSCDVNLQYPIKLSSITRKPLEGKIVVLR